MNLPKSLKGKSWAVVSRASSVITCDDLVRVLECIRDGRERRSAFVDCHSNSDLRVDKAITLLKRHGLIQLVDRKWQLTEHGVAALEEGVP